MAFPEHKQELSQIAAQHRQQEREPLWLAIYFADPNYPQYDSMLEVYEGYDRNRVSPEKEMLTTSFGTAASGFVVINDIALRLVITNPVEMGTAIEENWQHIGDVLSAVRSGKYEKIYVDPIEGEKLLKLLLEGQAVA